MDEISSNSCRAAAPPLAAEPLEDFAARCAHDFNNFLTGILGNLELMQNRARRTGVTQFDGYIEGARNAAGHAADFAQRLLLFSGRAAQEPVPVPVNRLARDVIDASREQSPPITADLNEDAGDAYCDPAQLELALVELLTNARQATSQAGVVTLRTNNADGDVTIAVSDTGHGMTPEVSARATEPFFGTRPGGAGKGMGLSIVNHIARHAGGTLSFETTQGQGATFTLTLPRHNP